MRGFLKWFFGIGLFLVLTLIISVYVIQNKVKSELKKYLNLSEERVYDFDYENLDLDIFAGDIVFESLKLIPRQQKIKDNHKSSMQLEVDEIRIEGIDVSEFIYRKTLFIKNLVILSPTYTIWTKTKKDSVQNNTVYERIFSDQFGAISLESIEVIDGKVTLNKLQGTDTLNSVVIQDIDLLTTNITVDTSTIRYIIPIKYDKFHLDLNDIQSENLIKNHHFKLDQLTLNADSAFFNLKGLSVVPQRFQFSKNWHETFNFQVKNILMEGIDFERFKYEEVIDAKNLVVQTPTININAFLHLPVDSSVLKKKPLPYDWIHNSKGIPYQFEKVEIRHAYLGYHIQQEDKSAAADFIISNIYARSNQLSNIDSLLGKPYRINISGKMLKEIPVSMNYSFNWNSVSKPFHVSGKIAGFDPKIFNKFLAKMANVQIRKGYINHSNFSFNSNLRTSTGLLEMSYQDIKVDIFKATKKNYNRHDDFLTRVANTVIKTHNLPDRKKYVIGKIQADRNPYKSVFNYNYKSIQSGLLSTMIKNGK